MLINIPLENQALCPTCRLLYIVISPSSPLSNCHRLFLLQIHFIFVCLPPTSLLFFLILGSQPSELRYCWNKKQNPHRITWLPTSIAIMIRGYLEKLHLSCHIVTIILSTLETSGQRGWNVHKSLSQLIQRGTKGPLCCPLFNSQDWIGPAPRKCNLVSFLCMLCLFTFISLYLPLFPFNILALFLWIKEKKIFP